MKYVHKKSDPLALLIVLTIATLYALYLIAEIQVKFADAPELIAIEEFFLALMDWVEGRIGGG